MSLPARVCRVLHEEELGCHNPKGLKDDLGQVSKIIASKHLSGRAERLARQTGDNHLSHAAIAFGEPLIVDLSEIAEQGGSVKDLVFDPLGEASLRML